MKQLYISQLNEHLGEALTEEFYLKDIFMKYTKDKGIAYLHLMLQDKTGSLAGRVWENNIEEEYLNLKGKVIKIYGEVLLNSKKFPEFIGWKMEPVTEYEIGRFINGLNEEETKQYLHMLQKQVSLIHHYGFHELVELVLNGQMEKLSEVPVSLHQAGAYNGSLLVQTVSVTSMSIQIMRSQKIYAYHPDLKINYQEDLLIAASLLFGIGTTNLYSPFPEAEKINEYALLPKDTLSIQLIESYSKDLKCFLSIEDKNLLYHMVQSAYKGEYQKPMIREAVILNMAYTTYLRISSQEFFLTENQQKSGTVFIPKLNHYIYLVKRPNGHEGMPSGIPYEAADHMEADLHPEQQ